jgi:protein-S-isoprenylcysteine O-methyltransferase Ste14
LLRRLAVQTAACLIVMALLLFVPAGNWRWPQAWVFLALFAVCSAGFGAWLARRDPGLLAERLASPVQHGQAGWDRIFLLGFVLIWFGWLALMALDAQRWRISHMPLVWNVVGGVLFVGGFLGVMLVFRENSFAAPVVRVQNERAQRVIDTGPYALVRHPMYAAGIIYMIGMPLLLGSLYGLLCVPVLAIAVAVRAVFEERLLKQQLPGYADYMMRVRWRLIPGVW